MILGVSGKIGSGKDTVGKIIQILTQSSHFTNKAVVEFLERKLHSPLFINKKFADTLKDFICVLLGCTREQLEDRDFKEKELGKEWWYYKVPVSGGGYTLVDYLNNNKHQDWIDIANPRYLVKTTPRLLLQLMGTECGRDILHPNVWVNALMSNYVSFHHDHIEGGIDYPKWIITDMRFPNELEAVKERGITIRINRFDGLSAGQIGNNEHPSETALDNATFDYIIDNNGSLEDLVDKIREILKKEKLI